MDVMIIAASPRTKSQSHTAAFVSAFSEGVHRAGASTEIFFLSDRTCWTHAESSFFRAKHIVFSMPVFCGTAPGTFIEFAEHLHKLLEENPSLAQDRKIAFLVHAGLPSDGDFRCYGPYLKTLPAMLGGAFAGLIGFGNTISLWHMEPKKKEMLQRLRDAGEKYAQNQYTFSPLEAFWDSENMSEADSRSYCRFINRFFRHLALAQGCEEDLGHAPYGNTD